MSTRGNPAGVQVEAALLASYERRIAALEQRAGRGSISNLVGSVYQQNPIAINNSTVTTICTVTETLMAEHEYMISWGERAVDAQGTASTSCRFDLHLSSPSDPTGVIYDDMWQTLMGSGFVAANMQQISYVPSVTEAITLRMDGLSQNVSGGNPNVYGGRILIQHLGIA